MCSIFIARSGIVVGKRDQQSGPLSSLGRSMRLIVARCSIEYSGRLSTRLADGVRLLMIKKDGTFMVWSDGGGQSVKPQN